MKAPLVIVGGGLVGAALALALERRGLAVQLVEPQPPSDARVDPRTVALSPASIDLLRTLGAWTDELPGACAYRAMDVWDAGGTGRIRFEAEALGVRSLGTIVPNGSALARLWARLAVRGVETITGAGVTALERLPGVTRLTLADERVLQTPLAIAADGGRSALRGFAGVPVRTTAMGQVAIATTAIVERPHEDTAWQRFMDTGPLALLPLADDADGRHRVSVVWSLDEAAAEAVRRLDDGAFAQALTSASEARLGRILEVAPRGGFPLFQVHADRYVDDGLVLVGDAAHVVHPLAGQGVNLGLKDVTVLTDVLADIASGPAARRIGEARMLRRYERARRGDNALALGAMEGLKRLFGAEDPGVRLLRNRGLSFVDRAASVKRAFAEHALGLD
ncbi:MAG: FAD-dependent monooxygenase [Pseudomonadota bacterium]|nr:FAD-dependent monooxygenase [Pseudomonadota bacterium]